MNLFVWEDFSVELPGLNIIFWLMVEPTHLKNMQPSNWVHLPQIRGNV